jgi:succinoglycan biosynthesis transport protein ExoP
MQNKPQGEHGAQMSLDDIYFILFRHKWKIIICFLLGVGVAVALYLTKSILYQSEAELLIQFITETPTTPGESSSQLRPAGGDSIIDSQIQILKSMDISDKVVDDIGAEKILAMWGGGKDRETAALLVNQHFFVDANPKSVVLHLVFEHPDRTLVQPILNSIIENYHAKQKDIYNIAGSPFLTQEKEDYANKLDATLKALKKAQQDADVISLEDAKRSIEEDKQKTSEELSASVPMIAEQKRRIDKIKKLEAINESAATNVEAVVKKPEINPDVLQQYTNLNNRLDSLNKLEQDRLSQYTESNILVVEVRQQQAEVKAKKKKLEETTPGLKKQAEVAKAASNSSTVTNNLDAETDTLERMQFQQTMLQDHMAAIKKQTDKIEDAETTIYTLEQNRKDEETQLSYYTSELEQYKINDELSVGKALGVRQVQLPSTPVRSMAQIGKLIGMALFGGLAAGLGWAFLIELYLDSSVKRTKEIERKLGLPLFISIPDVHRKDYRRRLKAAGDNQLLLKDTNDPDFDLPQANGNGSPLAPANGGLPAPVLNGAANGDSGKLGVAPWDHSHSLHPFYEALRNRLLSYFEVRNLHHKPKLVAVTGCSAKSGATTIAMGLAASLSETGDGNVLLVDMNLEQGGAQQFYKGKPRLDDALKSETRNNALVQDNLYVVSAGDKNDKVSKMLPKRFANLLPQLKASDYDYIIFDMPPVSRTGVTQRLAAFMDTILLVVEAEKTQRDVVRQASALLTESKANVSVVLNKTRSYIPASLHQEF